MNRNTHLILLVVAAGLAACGGGNDASPKVPPVANAPELPSPWAYQACDSTAAANPSDTDAEMDGLWQGSLTNEIRKTTEPFTALVSADGRIHLLSTGHTQLVAALDIDGNSYTGAGLARSGGRQWQDGTLISDLTVAGTIAERDQLHGDFVLASGDAGCFRLAYDADRYERPSSLDLVDGKWIDYDGWGFLWIAMDVTPQGAFTGTDIYGCSWAGSMALLDERFNLYAVTLDITQWVEEPYPCWGPGSFEGFAYLADSYDGAIVNHYLHLVFANEETTHRFTLNR